LKFRKKQMSIIKEVLQLRGYTITSQDDEIHFVKPDGKRGKVVFIKHDEKANVDDLAAIFKPIVKDPIHVIIIYKTITNPALNSFKNEISKYFTAELIPMSKLIRNPLNHRLSPTSYRKLSGKEKEQVLQQYKTEESKFPAMSPTDIIAVLFGFCKDDMIEITSHYNFTTKKVDMDMEPQITYRVVKDAL